jgi:hypothetical protein
LVDRADHRERLLVDPPGYRLRFSFHRASHRLRCNDFDGICLGERKVSRSKWKITAEATREK